MKDGPMNRPAEKRIPERARPPHPKPTEPIACWTIGLVALIPPFAHAGRPSAPAAPLCPLKNPTPAPGQPPCGNEGRVFVQKQAGCVTRSAARVCTDVSLGRQRGLSGVTDGRDRGLVHGPAGGAAAKTRPVRIPRERARYGASDRLCACAFFSQNAHRARASLSPYVHSACKCVRPPRAARVVALLFQKNG